MSLPDEIESEIELMVAAYVERRTDFVKLAKRVETDFVEHDALRPFIHSTKQREKDPTHLSDKLRRKATEAIEANKAFTITSKNLFERVGDLAGVRLLHIYTEQLTDIHPKIIDILKHYKYRLRKRPMVYIWDLERKKFLENLGLKVIVRPQLYTSVHYVVEPHWDKIGCEIQVRTLAEELWGEVSHKINYPHQTDSIACREQIAALARVASGCTRLVDSIFSSHTEHVSDKGLGKAKEPKG